jgi:hypothetical protein
MNRNTISIVLICTLSIMACVTSKSKITHDFPAAMAADVREGYIKQWEKGKTLYEMNCAKCHTTTVKGRTVVPDFTENQLVGYTLRVTNQKHEAALTDESVSTEELGLIMTFLTYKKKNNVK